LSRNHQPSIDLRALCDIPALNRVIETVCVEAARADALRRQIRPISTLAAQTFLVCGKPKSQEVVLVQTIHELLR